jgi:hypothetical protein
MADYLKQAVKLLSDKNNDLDWERTRTEVALEAIALALIAIAEDLEKENKHE